MYWNYFDYKEEIQIEWAFEENEEYDPSTGLSYEEYAEKYGTPVTTYNRFDADNFIELMNEMKESLKSDILKDDFDELIMNTQK